MLFFNRNPHFYSDDSYLALAVLTVSFNFKVIMEHCDRKREGTGRHIAKATRTLRAVVHANPKCSGNYKPACQHFRQSGQLLNQDY